MKKFTKRRKISFQSIVVYLLVVLFIIMFISQLIKSIDKEIAFEDAKINNFLTLQK